MSQLAIVSNRLPTLGGNGKSAPAGGLAVGLDAALREAGGTWFGWDGRVTAVCGEEARTVSTPHYEVVGLPLSEAEHAGYYLGFANQALWPLLHDMTDRVRFDSGQLETYRAVNRRFAQQLATSSKDYAPIWVHDYHFFLLGDELRRLGVERPIGFFLHTPFPAPDVATELPCHREIFGALAAFDLVGFQTERDRRNFQTYAVRCLGGAVSGDGVIAALGRRFATGVFPIGIDTQRFIKLAASPEAAAVAERYRRCFHDGPGMIGVDRLDYTKGLVNRLRAFERMIETPSAGRERAFLVQIASPSREAVPDYVALRGELEAISGQINARHACVEWAPLRYLNQTLSQTELAALYRLSRVGVVTPRRDGMNLVAKEYVAAQDADDPGVLVLSRFAGAAERLTGAVLVDPRDVEDMARAMRHALDMSQSERRARWSRMIAELREHDVHTWRTQYLRALDLAGRRPGSRDRQPAAVGAAGQPRGVGYRSLERASASVGRRPAPRIDIGVQRR